MIAAKTKKVILLFLLFFSAAAILESCCKQEYRLTGITDFYAVNSAVSYTNRNEAIQIIRNDFTMVVPFDKKIAGLNVRLTSTACALTCKPNLVNQILEENVQLTCNRSFVYNGDTVQQGTNILALQYVELSFHQDYSRSTPELYIYFTPDFVDRVSFHDSLHLFHLSVPTNDGLIFEKEEELLMLIN
ncbi:MAG: hypothetical protein V4615_09515 [Bacteroidota bacterium]